MEQPLLLTAVLSLLLLALGTQAAGWFLLFACKLSAPLRGTRAAARDRVERAAFPLSDAPARSRMAACCVESQSAWRCRPFLCLSCARPWQVTHPHSHTQTAATNKLRRRRAGSRAGLPRGHAARRQVRRRRLRQGPDRLLFGRGRREGRQLCRRRARALQQVRRCVVCCVGCLWRGGGGGCGSHTTRQANEHTTKQQKQTTNQTAASSTCSTGARSRTTTSLAAPTAN